MDDLVQLPLAVFSLLAVSFLSLSKKRQHWGPRFGLAGQPFWLVATWVAGQWGMFLMAIVFTIIYGTGVVLYFRSK